LYLMFLKTGNISLYNNINRELIWPKRKMKKN
jgi:hypothetical protein